ncbi:MAG: GAF domain-containing protein, partial [Myxococcales bacterium]
MKTPETPPNEVGRLESLADYAVLDTASEPAFDGLTQLAASILDVPIALISLVDVDRQWFKSRYGLDASQTPRDVSFCGHVVASDKYLVVPDAFLDDRFADNPLVTGAPHVRFYAGMPLRTPDGFVLGTLCAIDHRERRVSEGQLRSLELLADQVVALLELRRRSRLLREFKGTLDSTQDGIFIFEPDTLRFRYANRGAEAQTGYTQHELLRMTPLDLKRGLDAASFRSRLEPLLTGEESVILFEAVHWHRQGHQIPVEVIVQYVAHDGERPHFINIARDISERQRLDRLKDQFVATVSHELRTPLTSIRGSLGLVAGGVTG